MSRLGDLLRTERLRRKMTLKQVAKLSGVSESFLKDVEEGKRIIADDQARRILKKIGLTEQTEQGFTLDDIAGFDGGFCCHSGGVWPIRSVDDRSLRCSENATAKLRQCLALLPAESIRMADD